MLGIGSIDSVVRQALEQETSLIADPDELTAGLCMMIIKGISSGVLDEDACDEHWCTHFVEYILDDVKNNMKSSPDSSVFVVFSQEEGDCFSEQNRSVGVTFRKVPQPVTV